MEAIEEVVHCYRIVRVLLDGKFKSMLDRTSSKSVMEINLEDLMARRGISEPKLLWEYDCLVRKDRLFTPLVSLDYTKSTRGGKRKLFFNINIYCTTINALKKLV